MATSFDRDKALDVALAQIDKQHGKGAVMRLGDRVAVPMEVIPTGSIALDLALGIGGLPRGRVIEIYGPESSGKCLTAGTYIWTDQGLETIAELFARAGQKASCTSRVTDVRALGLRAVNEHGVLEQIAALTHNNRKPVVRLRLRSGRSIEATHNHPVRVVSEHGFVVWRKAGEIRVGDTVVSGSFGAVEAASGDGLSEDEAIFLGYLVAEGSLGYRERVRFTNTDADVAGEYVRIAEQLFGVEVRCYNAQEYDISGVAFRRRMHGEYGLEFVNAAGKSVPYRVRTSGHKAQRAFLSALFEGDGWIDTHSTVGLGTASEVLAEQVQLLLLGLNIPSSVRATWREDYGRNYWTVTINPAHTHRFLAEVGFRSPRRQAQVEAAFRRSPRDPQVENVPHVSGLVGDLRDDVGGDREFDRIAGDLFRDDMKLSCSRGRLQKIVRWAEERASRLSTSGAAILAHLKVLAEARLTFEPVVEVLDGGVQPTFDIMLPETHSFIANGVLSHNTTVALHAVANAQAAGGVAAFIDAEHALDPDYARALGVDTDALLVSQPDNGEQALEIADMLIRSGALDVIVIDSVAALVPRAEIEGEMGDSHVGLQARLMSQALRKLAGALSNSGTTAIFINQLREKIGVMFGCLSYGTRVVLADGSTEKIGKIVNQKLDVEVLSYDPETDAIIPRKVVNWFDNGVTDEFLQFTVEKSSGNGRSQFGVTENHLIRTPGGWRPAGELIAGDRVMAAETHRLGSQQRQVVLGSLLGDGNLSPNRRGRNGVRFRLGHGAKQRDYLDWKVSLLGNIACSRRENAKGAVFADFTPLAELGELQRAVYLGGGKKTISWEYLKALTPLALAIWFMDDGTFTLRSKGLQERTAGGSGRVQFCIEALSEGSRDRLVDYLRDTHGFEVSWCSVGKAQKAVLTFDTASSRRFLELVAPYVHPSMEYKLLPGLRGQFDVEPEFVDPVTRPVPARILDIHVKPKTRSMHRFDIEVEGNHNYFADGVMVHNSPETTTGGKALKFYASIRLDVRRIETLKDGTDAVGNRTRVKVVKNKCLAAGSTVFDPTTGMTHRIADIVDQRLPIHVVAAAKDGTLHVRPVVSWFDQGEQEVIGLRLAGGATLRVTPDHKVLTETGWRMAGELRAGDRVARPRSFLGFGESEPIAPDHARMLGYLIGDGYVGGKTPIHFINTEPALHDDAAAIAGSLGCDVHGLTDKLAASYSHRPGAKNGLIELCRSAGIYGKLAWEKSLPNYLFAADVSARVVANVVFGIFETDGWVSREQTGALRVGFTTTSEQLAHQIHWQLLRFGIGSSVRGYDPTGRRPSLIKGRRVQAKRPVWEVRIAGSENVAAFAEIMPVDFGPRTRVLREALEVNGAGRRRGSQGVYLSQVQIEPVLAHLAGRGVTALEAARMIGDSAGDPRGGMRQVLGRSRLRRDRLERLADALDDSFLRQVLAEEVAYTVVREVLPAERQRTFDVEVDELHTLVADGVVVHNCAPPFKQAEFDIVYGEGISREGSLIDVGVEQGLIKKSGAWYTYESDQLGQGKENVRSFLRDNPDLADEIEKKIKEKLGIGPRLDGAGVPIEPLPAPVDF